MLWWSDCEVLPIGELTRRAEQEGATVIPVPAFEAYCHGLVVIRQADLIWAVPLRAHGQASLFEVFQPTPCQWNRWQEQWQAIARQWQTITEPSLPSQPAV